jgi:hypothetical protein
MATEITCIVPAASDPDERIEMIGGLGWRKTESYAIAEVEHFHRDYFVEIGSARVTVQVEERYGRKYLRTDPDVTTENNLLSLPSCPA